MRRLTKWFGRILLATVTIAFVVIVAGFFWLRTSLPKTDGVVEVEGLSRSVEIIRDGNGIPHIFAANDRDAAFALGYVHAQDRLLQMELMRRFGAGRLAEVVGAPALRVDRMARTLGMYRRSEASFKHLNAETRAGLEAYATGVNAYLNMHSGALPLEFQLLGAKPEPWKPADSLVWGRIMATGLTINWRSELLRAYMAQRIGAKAIPDLWPPDPGDAPITIRDAERRRASTLKPLDLGPLLAAIPKSFKSGASNAWAVSGQHTKTGKPILANDPHLQIGTPILWYLVHIQTPQGRMVGATTPGVPTVLLGHNGHIAWGFTNTGPDSQDLFVERVDPDDPTRYLTPDGWRPFATRDEVIAVKDGDPVTLRVRATRHGPVLSDLLRSADAALDEHQVLALSWTALAEDDVSIQALLDLSGAEDWQGFVAAARSHGAPQQNVLYADTMGHIGFIAPGRVPIRAQGDGQWPVPGWTGAYDWQGMIPFEQLPQALDPPEDAFVNANNRIVTEAYPYLLSVDWSRRIVPGGSPSCLRAAATTSTVSPGCRTTSSRSWPAICCR